MTKNEDLKAIQAYDWFNKTYPFLTMESGLEHARDILKDATRPTITPTDGDSGKLADTLEKIYRDKKHSDSTLWPMERVLKFLQNNGYLYINAPTDGDAESALAIMDDMELSSCSVDCGYDFEDVSIFDIIEPKDWGKIRAALQSTRKPPDKCDGEPSTYWSTKQDFVHPVPVDTISIKREVLRGVREALKGARSLLQTVERSIGDSPMAVLIVGRLDQIEKALEEIK